MVVVVVDYSLCFFLLNVLRDDDDDDGRRVRVKNSLTFLQLYINGNNGNIREIAVDSPGNPRIREIPSPGLEIREMLVEIREMLKSP